MTPPEQLDASECLEHGPECDGPVEYRMPLSSTGRAFPRCEHHWELRLDTQQRHNERDAQARRVDYLDAGEVYDDDDGLDDFAIPGESPDPYWMNP